MRVITLTTLGLVFGCSGKSESTVSPTDEEVVGGEDDEDGAVVDEGAHGGDAVDDTAASVNTPPSCTILSPADGAAAIAAESHSFQGRVSDPDEPDVGLTIAWESDTDGPLGTAPPDTDGTTLLTIGSLSPGSHRITLTAVDGSGATCSAAIDHFAGIPPTVDIYMPVSGLNIASSPMMFAAWVYDDTTAPEDIVVTWATDIGGVFAEGTSSSEGTIDPSGATFDPRASVVADPFTFPVGEHVLIVTATDEHGLSSTDSLPLRVEAGAAPGVDPGP